MGYYRQGSRGMAANGKRPAQVWLSVEEHERAKRAATARGLTLAAWLRQLILDESGRVIREVFGDQEHDQ